MGHRMRKKRCHQSLVSVVTLMVLLSMPAAVRAVGPQPAVIILLGAEVVTRPSMEGPRATSFTLVRPPITATTPHVPTAALGASASPGPTTQELQRQQLAGSISSFYQRYLERNPDRPGLEYYINRVLNGSLSLDGVEHAISHSPEYRRLHPAAPCHANATYQRLQPIAAGLAAGEARACYRVAVATAARNGGINDGWQWKEDTSYRNRGLAALSEAIQQGAVKPGMVVYMNNRPGADRSSMNLAYKPHWMTYLGRDASGTPRFSDNYRANWTVSEIVSHYGSRRLDTIFNPYTRN